MPISIQSQLPHLDWYHYFNLFEKLPPQYKRVGEIVGIEEGFLASAIRGRIPTRTEAQRRRLAIHQRFYAALALLELVNEIPLKTVSRRYNINKGLLQSLQSSASTYAGMVTKFCEKLGWKCLELLIDQFQSRLSFGVTRELCDLVRISLLNGARARLLYNSGYHTVSAIAVASPCELAKLLEHFAPFESCKILHGESEKELETRRRVRNFWVTGRNGMTEAEAAEEIVHEAKELVRKDLANMGVEINRVEFLSDKRELDVNSEGTRSERLSSESKQEPLQKGHSQSRPKDDLKGKPNDVSGSKMAVSSGPPSLRNIQMEQQLALGSNFKGNWPIGAINNARGDENKENIELDEFLVKAKSSQGKRSLLDASKKLLISIGCNGKEICKNMMKESSTMEKEHSTAMNEPGQKLECERDKELQDDVANIFVEDDKSRETDNDDDFHQNKLVQFQDYISILNDADKELDKALDGNLGDNPKASSPCPQSTNAEKTAENIDQKLALSISPGSFDESSIACSIDDGNGSLILISSREDTSLNESERSKDITPELFSETPWDDVEVDPAGIPCSGIFPVADKSENLKAETPHILIEDSLKECKGSSPDILNKIVDDAGALICEENSGDSFHIRLSKSVLEVGHEVVDVLGNDLERREGETAGRRVSRNAQIVKEEQTAGNAKAVQDNGVNNEVKNEHFSFEQREHSIDSILEKSQCNFTKVLHISERREFDWDKFLSGSDSFANALCNVSLNGSPEIDEMEVKSSIQSEETKAHRIAKEDENGKYEMKHRDRDKSTGMESYNKDEVKILTTAKADETINENEKCEMKNRGMESYKDIEVDESNNVINRQKGKRKTYNCEGEHACEVKRRSSERIAEKILQLGGTEEFTIVDVSLSQETFNMFIEVWGRKDSFSFSLARLCRTDIDAKEGRCFAEDVSGVAVCLGGNTAYYIDFVQSRTNDINKVKEILGLKLNTSKKIVFDAKEHYKALLQSLGVELKGRFHDPKVAAWLLDPSSKEMTLQELAMKHLPQKCRKLVNSGLQFVICF